MNKKHQNYLGLFLVIAIMLSINVSTSFAAPSKVTITLQKTSQIIPTNVATTGWDLVNLGQVLYKVTIKATVKSGTKLINGSIAFSNPSNSGKVKLVNSGTVTTNGVAYASYEVRGCTAFTATATMNTSLYTGTASTTITPTKESNYESSFKITCYNTADESDFSGSKITVDGISGAQFKEDFIKAVKLNGSGYSSNGYYIRYVSNNKYEKRDPVTASGTTPTTGKTIAVDNYYIPRYNNGGTYTRGCINITDIGRRQAEDSGGAISKYRIDVYVGKGKSAVQNFTHSGLNKSVKYLGNDCY